MDATQQNPTRVVRHARGNSLRKEDLQKYTNVMEAVDSAQNLQGIISPAPMKRLGSTPEGPETVELATLGVEQLATWMAYQLSERFLEFHAPFMDHKIDGRCFSHITEKHLEKMVPTSALGDRLHILALRDHIVRATRIRTRNLVLMEGSAFIDPPGTKGQYILTHGSLKLIFNRKKQHELGSGAKRSVDSTFVDHIDLRNISDVDIEEATDMEEVYDTEVISSGFCCPSKKQERRLRERREDKVVKLYITLLAAAVSKEALDSRYITVTLDNVDVGKALHQQMIDAMEEVHRVHVVHYE